MVRAGKGGTVRLQDITTDGTGFPELVRTATEMLRRCKVTPDEEVVVYTDTGGDASLAEAIQIAATNLGCDTTTVIGTPRFALLDPSDAAVDAMRGADVVFDLASTTWSDYALAAQRICDAGTRILQVMLPPACFVERPPTSEILERVARWAQICDAATELRVVGPHGTDLSFARGDLPLDWGRGLVDKPGTWDSYGVFSISFTPVPESVNGTLAFNGPMTLLPQHRFVAREPIVTELREGKITSIRDDHPEAKLLLRWFEQFEDEGVYEFSHAGAGVDHRANTDVVDVNGWESILGAVVVGIGASSNVGLQGQRFAKGHMDGVLLESSLYVDGRLVIEDGSFTPDSGVVA
jgi:leucyl aminopeptidase (aminopeptidase T)